MTVESFFPMKRVFPGWRIEKNEINRKLETRIFTGPDHRPDVGPASHRYEGASEIHGPLFTDLVPVCGLPDDDNRLPALQEKNPFH